MFKGKGWRVHPSTTDTLIGEGTVFRGTLTSAAGIRIEGKVIGQISCIGSLIIGEKGVVHSTVEAAEIIVAGQLFGDVYTAGKLSITTTGQLKGTVKAHTLAIDPGAVFQGLSDMPAKQSPPMPDSAPPDRGTDGGRIAAGEQLSDAHAQSTLGSGLSVSNPETADGALSGDDAPAGGQDVCRDAAV